MDPGHRDLRRSLEEDLAVLADYAAGVFDSLRIEHEISELPPDQRRLES